MNTTTAPIVAPVSSPARPGSRAARMALPRSVDVLKDLASEHGVCGRPVSVRRTSLTSGQTEVIDLPCGATLEAKCPPCARKARRLRQVQIREGWHRTSEPIQPESATEDHKALITYRAHLEFARAEAMRSAEWGQIEEIDAEIRRVTADIAAAGLRGKVAPDPTKPEDAKEAPKRKRSTRRRQDTPDLPRQKVDRRTVGQVYVGRDGAEHRPSMWLSMTLDSYGPVREDGTPVNPARYDYRRAAWDAVAFPRLLDRFWQNLRRCVGWNVQYAGCVEPQRRLAPHAHFAIRGTIPRETLRAVARATYHQVWWPTVEQPVYQPDGQLPVWDVDAGTWVAPDTTAPLMSWDAALDEIDADPDAEPAHVARFGTHVHAEGVNPGTEHAARTVRYITKYLTKNVSDCHDSPTARQRAHLERFWQELRVTPCSDRCANWLLYGIQPKKAHERLRPGNCRSRVHQRATLGLLGRRILISREWSGKTLTDHRADARGWVKNLLGITEDATDQDQPEQYAWELARPDDGDLDPLPQRLLRAVSERIRWRTQLRQAQQRAGLDPPRDLSATDQQGTTGED